MKKLIVFIILTLCTKSVCSQDNGFYEAPGIEVGVQEFPQFSGPQRPDPVDYKEDFPIPDKKNGDFVAYPFVKIKQRDISKGENIVEGTSGTVVKVDKDYYYILTCAHGIGDAKIRSPIYVGFTNPSQKYVYKRAEVLNINIYYDLAYIMVQKNGVYTKPVRIRKYNPPVGSKVRVYGYAMGERPNVVHELTIDNFNKWNRIEVQIPWMELKGYGEKNLPGNSGGGIIYNDPEWDNEPLLVGVQWGGFVLKGPQILCSNVEHIVRFLKLER